MNDHRAGTSASGFDHLDRGRSVLVETPEHVGIGFELAGIGSRAAAVVLDVLALTLAVLLVWLAGIGLPSFVESELLQNAGLSLAVLAIFLLQWGYFFLAEGLFGGRTLGKRVLGLRVIGAGGTPVTLQAAALRNLIRFVDFQPAGSSVVGLAMIALHPRAQRLGDVVAGTVVVRDRGDHEIPEKRAAEKVLGRPRLERRQFDVLEAYIQRRDALSNDVRRRLAARVSEAMGPPIAEHPRRTASTLDDLLLELYRKEEPLQAFGSGTSLQAVLLVRAQTPAWERCRELVAKARRRGLATLDEQELEEFTSLYRQVVSDLARARAYGGSLRLCFHLERLAGEAHNLFYRGGRAKARSSPIRWLRHGFPSTVRQHRAHVAVAAILLFGPAFVTYAGVRSDPEVGRRVVAPAMVARAEEAGERLRNGDPYIDVPAVQMSVFSSQIMTNNIQVALIAAAGGALAGLGTVLVLVLNGIHLGSVFAMFDVHEAGRLLWTFVLPHGVLELTAIVVAGGAGLLLGHAIVAPGRRTRAQALREEGRVSLSLLAGCGVLLVLAGLIEGFVSPARIPAAAKMGFAGAVAVLLVLYLLGPGEPTPPDSLDRLGGARQARKASIGARPRGSGSRSTAAPSP